MTTSLVLRLTGRLLIVTSVPTAITDLCRLAHLGLRWSTQVREGMGQHVLMLILSRLSSLRREAKLIRLVCTAEVSMRVYHTICLLLVEHLELSTGLLVPYSFHKGLRSTKRPSLLRLLSQCRQLTSQIDSLIFWRHGLLLTLFSIKLKLYVSTHAALVLRSSLISRVIAEAQRIHKCLVMAATTARLLRLCQILR